MVVVSWFKLTTGAEVTLLSDWIVIMRTRSFQMNDSYHTEWNPRNRPDKDPEDFCYHDMSCLRVSNLFSSIGVFQNIYTYPKEYKSFF